MTDQLPAVAPLGESDQRFRALAENASVGIFVIDESSTIRFVNPAVERIFCYTVDELIGQPLGLLMPEDQQARHLAGMRRYLETGRRNVPWDGMELPGRTKDGRRVPLEISFGEFESGGQRYFTGIARDISKRKQAEQELRESEERYRLLADMIPQHIWITEADGYHGYFSRRWYEYTGATPEETRGEGWLRLVHPDDRDRTVARWQHSLRTGEPYSIEYRFRAADGSYSWFLGQAMPLRDQAGEIIRWFGTLTDISDRKQHEEERERLLASEHDARTQAERQRDELVRMTDSRARLMRGFSHDVKNPLGAADGYLHLMSVRDNLTEKQQERVAKVRRSIKAALNLIEDLLDLARAEAGEIDIAHGITDLRAVARDAVDEYRAQAESNGLSLTIDVAPDLPVVLSDARRIRQIVGNLLSNAVKYTERGGIDVRVATAEGQDAPGPGRWIAVSVADTGLGIPADHLSLVFQEFSRLDGAGVAKGTGIGLAISRRIAQALGGDISVTSETGKGSTFTLWLPGASARKDQAGSATNR